MRARRLIEGAPYDRATIKAMCQAFDEAWASIKDKDYFPQEVDRARLALANSMLAIAWRYGQDVDALKKAALQH